MKKVLGLGEENGCKQWSPMSKSHALLLLNFLTNKTAVVICTVTKDPCQGNLNMGCQSTVYIRSIMERSVILRCTYCVTVGSVMHGWRRSRQPPRCRMNDFSCRLGANVNFNPFIKSVRSLWIHIHHMVGRC